MSYINNILSKNIVKKLIYIIGFILLIINFSTNFINGGEGEYIGSTPFISFQKDSEHLVVSEIINDKYNLINNKYGLSRVTDSNNNWEIINYSGDNIEIIKSELDKIHVEPYVSQVGIQGHVISFLYNTLNFNINVIKFILVSLLAIVLLYICKYISIKFNKKLSFIYFIVFLLSPWICAFARNLYWVEFTWFLPMLLGLILSTNYSKKKIIIPLIFISIFIKCLCGYEYITVIMLSMIMFMVYDLIFDKNNKKEIFKTIFLVGITALLGFMCAFLIHSHLRGNGNLMLGIKNIYEQDVLRRTLNLGNNSAFSGIYLESIQASPITTLKKYFVFSTNIITGINGSLFRLLFISSIMILLFNFIIKRKNSVKEFVLYLFSFVTCISWFIFSSPHSYIHTHINYVLWYFGFIQLMLYIIINFIIYILKMFIVDNKNKDEDIIISNDVPNYEKKEYSKKKNKYCLCIPIINEGDRIRKELELAKKHNINKLVDIIICDGGSTDGSTSDSEMKKLGVNTLLIKKDVGKQGAQLRMGFSFALEREYEGIITIDGNNKDSIEDVPNFIKKLEEGYDFVQGSRFIKGGQAINTPLMRYLSVRLLHAPIISLTAGEKFTDTTNAYRAYSKKYLTDPRVQPLRNIFQTYELLAYLSVKASQLGLKTCEIPVRREYPKIGKIPTKISLLKGNYELLKILFKNAFGYYDVVVRDKNEV